MATTLTESLRRACIRIGTEARDKDGVLRELARLAKASPILASYSESQVYDALREREEIGSTAFGKGIAIPHCGLAGIDDFVVGILAVRDGVDFDSCDGEPVRLFVLIVGPQERRNDHVSLLSGISRVLDDEAAVQELLAQHDPLALEESFLRHHSGHLPGQQRERVLFHVIVQNEDVFDGLVRIFSGAVEGDLTVLEANNASAYLNRLPMFSAFWSSQDGGFCRVIMAIVDKQLANDVVRRINLEVDDLDHRTGVLITVQELLLVRGSLAF